MPSTQVAAPELSALLEPSKLTDPVYVEFLRLTDRLSRQDVEAYLPSLRRLVASREPSCTLRRPPTPHPDPRPLHLCAGYLPP